MPKKSNPVRKRPEAMGKVVTRPHKPQPAPGEVEEWYRLVAESTSDYIVVTSPDSTILYASPSHIQLGYDPADLVGRLGFEFLHPDDMPHLAYLAEKYTDDALEIMLTEQPSVSEFIEYRFRDKEGNRHDMETAINWSKSARGDKHNVVCISRDATNRKTAEEAQRRSEEYYRSLLENAMEAITVVNSDGTLKYESPSYRRVLGRSPEDTAGVNTLDFVHPDDLPGVAETFAQLLDRPGATVQAEVRGLHEDGSYRTLEIVGRNLLDDPVVGGIVANFRDITERKQVEVAVKAAYAELDQVFETAGAGMLVIGRNFTVLRANSNSSAIFGVDAEEIVGRKCYDVQPGDACHTAECPMARIAGGEECVELEVERTGPNGVPVSCLMAATPLRTSDGELAGVVESFIDVTERKQVEVALRDSEEKYRTILEDMEDGYYEVDTAGNFTFFNAPMCRMLGYSRDEMMGMNNRQYMDEESTKKVYQAFNQVFTTAQNTKEFGWEVVRKDGTKKFIEASVSLKSNAEGETIGFRGIVRDITERKQAEEALRESERRLGEIFGNVSEAIFYMDTNGVFLNINQRSIDICGLLPDEIAGRNFADLAIFDDEELSRLSELFATVVSQSKPMPLVESRVNHNDGHQVPVEVAIRGFAGPNGELQGFMGTIRDISERKRMEQQLLLSGRLAAIGELAAGVAHELNNPLAAVQGFAQLLTSRDDLEESIRSDVETIFKEAKRASTITANLLQFARKHEPERTLVSVNEIVRKSLELHTYRMNVSNIDIVLELDPNLPTTMADSNQMQQVFVNIITNAGQAMTAAHGEGKLTLKTRRSRDAIQIAFRDDGPGIPEENLKQVFDPFFTTKGVGEGTGLGLSICFGIIEQHGGTIHVESKLGKGTTLTVELPIVTADEAKREQAEQLCDQSTSVDRVIS